MRVRSRRCRFARLDKHGAHCPIASRSQQPHLFNRQGGESASPVSAPLHRPSRLALRSNMNGSPTLTRTLVASVSASGCAQYHVHGSMSSPFTPPSIPLGRKFTWTRLTYKLPDLFQLMRRTIRVLSKLAEQHTVEEPWLQDGTNNHLILHSMLHETEGLWLNYP